MLPDGQQENGAPTAHKQFLIAHKRATALSQRLRRCSQMYPAHLSVNWPRDEDLDRVADRVAARQVFHLDQQL